MLIENEFTVAATRKDVADFLLTPERMLPCVPGLEDFEIQEDGTCRARLKARVGPVSATFSGDVQLDGSEAPARIRATARGKDRFTGSTVQVVLESSLSETEPGVTTVCNGAELTLRGRLARFGSSVIRPISEDMIDKFANCVHSELAGGNKYE